MRPSPNERARKSEDGPEEVRRSRVGARAAEQAPWPASGVWLWSCRRGGGRGFWGRSRPSDWSELPSGLSGTRPRSSKAWSSIAYPALVLLTLVLVCLRWRGRPREITQSWRPETGVLPLVSRPCGAPWPPERGEGEVGGRGGGGLVGSRVMELRRTRGLESGFRSGWLMSTSALLGVFLSVK
jgi:hypothetical protein